MAAIRFDIADPGPESGWTVTVPGPGGTHVVASAPEARAHPSALVLASTVGVVVGALGTWALSTSGPTRAGDDADHVAPVAAARVAAVPRVTVLSPGLAVVHLPSGQWVVCVLPQPPAGTAPDLPLTAPVQDRVRPTTARWACHGAAGEDRFGS